MIREIRTLVVFGRRGKDWLERSMKHLSKMLFYSLLRIYALSCSSSTVSWIHGPRCRWGRSYKSRLPCWLPLHATSRPPWIHFILLEGRFCERSRSLLSRQKGRISHSQQQAAFKLPGEPIAGKKNSLVWCPVTVTTQPWVCFFVCLFFIYFY